MQGTLLSSSSASSIFPDGIPVDPLEHRHIELRELNDMITCKLCHGYLIEATTVVECLHTFCKACIVKHLDDNVRHSEFGGYEDAPYSSSSSSGNHQCPECGHLIHQSHPLDYISFDRTMQDLVYKIVPDLELRELERERKFYADRGIPCPKDAAVDSSNANSHEHSDPNSKTNDQSCSTSENYSKSSKNDSSNASSNSTENAKNDLEKSVQDLTKQFHRLGEQVNLLVEQEQKSSSDEAHNEAYDLKSKYVRVAALATVTHVKKFVSKRIFGDIDRYKEIDVKCNGENLFKDHTLKFVYVTKWRTKKPPLALQYVVNSH